MIALTLHTMIREFSPHISSDLVSLATYTEDIHNSIRIVKILVWIYEIAWKVVVKCVWPALGSIHLWVS